MLLRTPASSRSYQASARRVSLAWIRQAMKAPIDTAPITRGRSSISARSTSQKPACHQQRCPPPAKTTLSNMPQIQ